MLFSLLIGYAAQERRRHTHVDHDLTGKSRRRRQLVGPDTFLLQPGPVRVLSREDEEHIYCGDDKGSRTARLTTTVVFLHPEPTRAVAPVPSSIIAQLPYQIKLGLPAAAGGELAMEPCCHGRGLGDPSNSPQYARVLWTVGLEYKWHG